MYKTQSDFFCPYSVLGVRCNATKTEIKRAFRRLSLLYHPCRTYSTDTECSDKQKKWKFQAISASYETLIDETTRRRFDTLSRSFKKMYNGPERSNDEWIMPQQKLFFGPFYFIHRARNYLPFTCPYELFNTEFQSDLFNTVRLKQLSSFAYSDEDLAKPFQESDIRIECFSFPPLAKNNNSSTSTTWISQDDKEISRTSRIIGNRKITRTKTIITDPITDMKSSIIEVSWEEDEIREENHLLSDPSYYPELDLENPSNNYLCCCEMRLGTNFIYDSLATTLFPFCCF